MPPVYALSIHADYRCGRSGVCCSSDWDVPVELEIYRSLDDALHASRLNAAGVSADGGAPLAIEGDLPDEAAAMVARTATGDCVFFHRTSGDCVIHRDLGEAHLPLTCRYFPRLALRDARGTFVALSHYCPTAATSLFREDVPLAIVENPLAFPPGEYEGLMIEADAWPPLLRPRMLMELESYSEWERHMVRRCADAALSPEDVLGTLERDARILRAFDPDSGSLGEAIKLLAPDAVLIPPHTSLERSLELYREVMQAVPDDLRPAPDQERLPEAFEHEVAPGWNHWRLPLKRYLGAKAFASWTAYQGRGLLTIVRGLEAALALVRVAAARECRDAGRALDGDLLREAFRNADFTLNHLAVGEDLAALWSRAEEE